MNKFFIILLLTIFIGHEVNAQDTLPGISVNQLGRKALVAWKNPYNNITSINIQRSGDSVKNFTTIGSVLNVNATENGFVDTKEFLPNDQYYRLFISFEGGSYIFTKAKQPLPDTSFNVRTAENLSSDVKTWFVPSRRVYTGKENNIIISLRDAATHKYSIKFFENDGTFLFEVKKIPENYLILDKVNFVHSGLFNFELFDDKILIEHHKVYIPKDGKSAPSLDVNGYEIKQ
ncbi:MAG: hypothetical protein ACMG51_10385 [Ginsengibacter sp.]